MISVEMCASRSRSVWITLKDLLTKYGRPLKEYELWALCHECLHALQACIDYPAYLSLDTVMIDSHGEILFSFAEDAECCDAFYLAPEFEEQGLVTEKVCVYGVAAILWTAAKCNCLPEHKLSLPKKLKKLLLNMAKRNANERPSVTDALQMCKEYLFQQDINSKEIWSQLNRCVFQQAGESEDTILQDRVSFELAYKHDKEGSFESTVGFVPITNIRRLTAVKGPVPCQFSLSNETSRLPNTFLSPTTYFKPIILMQNTDNTRNEHKIYRTSSPDHLVKLINDDLPLNNKESVSVNDIERHAISEHSATVDLLTPQSKKQTTSSVSNSSCSSLREHTPNNLLSFTVSSASTLNSLSDQNEIISTAASSGSSVSSASPFAPLLPSFLCKQDPKVGVEKLVSLKLTPPEQIHFQKEAVDECLSNPPEILSCSLDNIFKNNVSGIFSSCDQTIWSSSNIPTRQKKGMQNKTVSQNDSPNSYSSFDTINNDIKMNSKEAEVCKEKLGSNMPFPDNSSSMDSNPKCYSDLKTVSQQKTICSSLQKVVHLIHEEFAFDGYLENGVEDLAMGEYIFALKGLQFGTFCDAVSEKFYDLYWDATLLENLYTVVNGETPSLIGISKDVSQNLKRNTTSRARKKTRKNKKPEKQSSHTQLNLMHHEESVCIASPLPEVSFQTDGSPKAVNLNSGKETAPTVDFFYEMNFKKFLRDSFEKECRPQHPLLRTETKKHSIEKNLLQGDSFILRPAFTEVNEENTEDRSSTMTDICNPGWITAFYGAQCFLPDVQNYVKKLGIQKENETPNLRAKKLELQQQIKIETKHYMKTIKFHQKLLQKDKRNKDIEVRTMLVKLKRQLEEMKSKVHFLGLVKKYLQVVDAEQWGLEKCALPIVINMTTRCEMKYNHSDRKSLQIFYNVKEHEGDKNNIAKILQAGTPLELMAYLYTRKAILEGYVQQFLYTFRYFCSQQDFLQFLTEKATSTLSSENLDSSSICTKIYNRTLYLLQAWIEDCCIVDFTTNANLLDKLENFLYSRVILKDNRGKQLLSLLQDIASKGYAFTSAGLGFVQQQTDEDTKSLDSVCKTLSEDYISRKSCNWKLSQGNEPITLLQKEKQHAIASALPRLYCPNFIEGFSRSCVKADERRSYFINEYSIQQLSNQLTLLQERMFQKCHPVHFLNSRALGVKDRVTTATKTVSTEALAAEVCSLFVQDCIQDNYLIQLLRYGDNVSTWVAAEIVTSHTSKLQANLLSKFLLTAKCCYKQRNFATAMQILRGLENLIVRQLPVWKSLPSKVSEILKELKAAEVFLKSDSLCLMEGDKFKTLPTIPSAYLLAMHIQQLETGGFTLVNGTCKWTKLRNIAKVVSQVHAFQDVPYTLTPDPELQCYLKKSFARFSEADISALAAHNNINFYQIPAEKCSKRLQDTLHRMKTTFQ